MSTEPVAWNYYNAKVVHVGWSAGTPCYGPEPVKWRWRLASLVDFGPDRKLPRAVQMTKFFIHSQQEELVYYR